MSQGHRPLFYLAPRNPRTREVVQIDANRDFKVHWEEEDVLQIGLVRSRAEDVNTLVTLGRDGDIVISGYSTVSRVQCSFGIHPDSGVVMFYDDSHGSQVFGHNCTKLQPDQPRKAVVNRNWNTAIGFGGTFRNLFVFELKWPAKDTDTIGKVKDEHVPVPRQNPRLARTINDTDTIVASRTGTRFHTPWHSKQPIRYEMIKDIGAGQSGSVISAVDIANGDLMAVKVIKPSADASKCVSKEALRDLLNQRQRERDNIKSEIELVSRVSVKAKDAHIVNYIDFQSCDDGRIEMVRLHSLLRVELGSLFMELQEGTLESLFMNEGLQLQQANNTHPADTALEHILQALDFLSTQNIIHRDIKPENIFYATKSGNYVFQLGDFGLSRSEAYAQTFAGTPIYMAPEVYRGQTQTHKCDIWSLYVTMLWTMNVQSFREEAPKRQDVDCLLEFIQSCAAFALPLREMARSNPDERASAAQMLVKIFAGRGLSTKAWRVPELAADKETPKEASQSAIPTPGRPIPTSFRDLRERGRIRKTGSTPRRSRATSPRGYAGRGLQFLMSRIGEGADAAAEKGDPMVE
ncbi:kinase-like domain-containing protein [Xylariaceae sp. FL1272]|nr:kinase-like domain-containing protein [Xylariaceae sp. FL1272]